MLKIRLRQQGARNSKTYRLVVTDAKKPRDGAYIECVGSYAPQSKEEKNAQLNEERLCHWIGQGAELTESAESLVKRYAPAAYKLRREQKAK